MIPQIKRILYATDLTKNSAYAFFFAVDMARRHDAGIVILHVIDPINSQLNYADSGVDLMEMARESKKKERAKDIEEIKNNLGKFCEKIEARVDCPCVRLVTEILVATGYPVEEILKRADEDACDVIVMGTHGKGFLKQTFLGSVAGSVLERTRKPVFIIPLPSDKTEIEWDKI